MAVLDRDNASPQLALGFASGADRERIALMRAALARARPFVLLEAQLANSGLGKLGNGDAPETLAMLDRALLAADEALAP